MNKYVVYACWIGVLGGLIFTVFCPSSPVYGWLNKGSYERISSGYVFDTSRGVLIPTMDGAVWEDDDIKPRLPNE